MTSGYPDVAARSACRTCTRSATKVSQPSGVDRQWRQMSACTRRSSAEVAVAGKPIGLACVASQSSRLEALPPSSDTLVAAIMTGIPLPEPVDLDLYRVRNHAHVDGIINDGYRLIA